MRLLIAADFLLSIIYMRTFCYGACHFIILSAFIVAVRWLFNDFWACYRRCLHAHYGAFVCKIAPAVLSRFLPLTFRRLFTADFGDFWAIFAQSPCLEHWCPHLFSFFLFFYSQYLFTVSGHILQQTFWTSTASVVICYVSGRQSKTPWHKEITLYYFSNDSSNNDNNKIIIN